VSNFSEYRLNYLEKCCAIMKISMLLTIFVILAQANANSLEDIAQLALQNVLKQNPNHNLLVVLDFSTKSSKGLVVDKVLKKVPESFLVLQLSATGLKRNIVDKPSAMMIFSDNYNPVSFNYDWFA
jgi:hypothetical protein